MDRMSDALDLLPSNATPLEQELARLSHRLDEIDPAVIETLWDAWRCPAELLPHLAWALSLDVWDDAWSEGVKRQAIADAPAVHRTKGTRYAVDNVLKLLGCRISFKEWWQQTPPGRRGTARAMVLVLERQSPGAPLITPDLIARVNRALLTTKPKSRAISLEMAVGARSQAGLSTVGAAAALGINRATAAPPMVASSKIGAATSLASAMLKTASATATPPLVAAARFTSAAVASAASIITARMEATLS
jgi:phage tail P2-like protein